jgi:RHS repeat-associated protein
VVRPRLTGHQVPGLHAKTTTYVYDAAARKTSETTPKSETIGYTYNAAGDLLTLTDGRGKVTTWTYDNAGRVKTKQYHGQSFADLRYDYDAEGRLAWRRFYSSGSVYKQTGYTFDPVGNLTFIDYPNSPDVTFQYDALNRLESMTDAVGTTGFQYTPGGNLWKEILPWASHAITHTYHPSVPRPRTGLTVQQPTGNWSQSFGYDAARRLQTVGGTSGTFTYTYKGAGILWTNLALPNTSRITNAFDSGARLSGTWLRNSSGTILNKHVYQYNSGGQRSKQTRQDNSYINYGYDNDAQLVTALGYTSGGSPISAEQLGYTYDGGWNMTERSVNGSLTAYTINDRNQVTSVSGVGNASFDSNGNLVSRVYDSNGPKMYYYSYDDENQLIEMRTDTYYTSSADRFKTTWTYDGLGRARIRREYHWDDYYGGQWTQTGQVRYIYDGMRVIQERNGSNTPLVSYTRGNDLSGSLEGAGGIGGLLGRSHGYSSGSWSTHNHYHADGNGNVTYLVNSSQGLAASYRYDPYGRLMGSSGTLAAANLYRFSSKELHAKSGMYYYGYRFYEPFLQRWINRDPIGELGGINLYTFVGNDPTGTIDPDGRFSFLWPIIIVIGGAGYAAWEFFGAFDKAKEAGDEFRDLMEDDDWFNQRLLDRGEDIAAAGAEALEIAGGFPGLVGTGLSESIWPVTRAGEIVRPLVRGFELGIGHWPGPSAPVPLYPDGGSLQPVLPGIPYP